MTSPEVHPGPVAVEAVAGPDPAPPAVPPRWHAAADVALRTLAGLLCVAAALLTGLLELLYAPLRAGGQLLGLSIPAAALANVALAWFAYHGVGRRWAVALPWVAWTALMFLAAGTVTTEGDYLLSADNWVALPMILAGSVAFGGYTYRLIVVGPARRSPVPGPPSAALPGA